MNTETTTSFEQWCILELLGHVRLAGKVTEQELFGSKLGRIDIPSKPNRDCLACKGSGRIAECAIGSEMDEVVPAHACRMCEGFTTQYFAAGSIYRLTPTTEEVARRVAAGSQPQPVHRWELPAPATDEQPSAFDDMDDNDSFR